MIINGHNSDNNGGNDQIGDHGHNGETVVISADDGHDFDDSGCIMTERWPSLRYMSVMTHDWHIIPDNARQFTLWAHNGQNGEIGQDADDGQS